MYRTIILFSLVMGCSSPDIQYLSGPTGVVCDSCYAGSHCDPTLLPEEEVDDAVMLTAATLINNGLVNKKDIQPILDDLWICIVDTAGMQRSTGGYNWPNGDCVTLDVPGTCIAGQYFGQTIKITRRDPQGVVLKTWETALVHELCHYFYLVDNTEMYNITTLINEELKQRWQQED